MFSPRVEGIDKVTKRERVLLACPELIAISALPRRDAGLCGRAAHGRQTRKREK